MQGRGPEGEKPAAPTAPNAHPSARPLNPAPLPAAGLSLSLAVSLCASGPASRAGRSIWTGVRKRGEGRTVVSRHHVRHGGDDEGRAGDHVEGCLLAHGGCAAREVRVLGRVRRAGQNVTQRQSIRSHRPLAPRARARVAPECPRREEGGNAHLCSEDREQGGGNRQSHSFGMGASHLQKNFRRLHPSTCS